MLRQEGRKGRGPRGEPEEGCVAGVWPWGWARTAGDGAGALPWLSLPAGPTLLREWDADLLCQPCRA